MNTGQDWMKSNHEELLVQGSMTTNYLESHMTDFGIAGKSAKWVTDEYIPKFQTFGDAFNEWRDPSARTKTKIAALKIAEKQYRTAYRELYTGYLKGNMNVTDADLVTMGLPARSEHKHTPVPAPTSRPAIKVNPDGVRRLKVLFHDNYTLKTAKPHGVVGAVLRWVISPTPPANISDLTNSALDTKTPYLLNFEEDQRGKTVYLAAAWQNTKGELGSWSEIVNAIVP